MAKLKPLPSFSLSSIKKPIDQERLQFLNHKPLIDDFPIGDIIETNNFRDSLRNIPQLAASIAEVGLIQPIVLRPNYEIVAGRRRLAAFRHLGRTTIPAIIVQTYEDELKALMAEAEENTQREDFTPAEIFKVLEKLEPMVSPIAAERIRRNQFRSGKDDSGPGKVVPTLPGEPNIETSSPTQNIGEDDPGKVGTTLPGDSSSLIDLATHLTGKGRTTIVAAQTLRKKGSPELIQSVKDGKISLAAAAQQVRNSKKQKSKAVRKKLKLKLFDVQISLEILLTEKGGDTQKVAMAYDALEKALKSLVPPPV